MAKSSMADDRYSRVTRPSEGFRREAPPAGQESDPLMELARLIGQADPFADMKPPRDKAPPPSPRIADPSTWHELEAASHAAPGPAPSPRTSLATPLWPDPPAPTRPELSPQRVEPPALRIEPPPLRAEPAPLRAAPQWAPPAPAQPGPYDEPAYDEAAYQQPGYPEPGYQEPAYQPPAYDPHAYREPEPDLRVEPEALETWRPNDPYQHTEGMFPHEPQVFNQPASAPAFSQAAFAAPAAPGYAPRGEAPQRQAGAVFDPDDPLGFERDARAAEVHSAAAYGEAAYGQGVPGQGAPSQRVPSQAAPGQGVAADPGYYDAGPASIAADRLRNAVDRDRGLAAPPPAAAPAAAYGRPAAAPGQPPYGDFQAAYADVAAAGGQQGDMGDERYTPEELATYYATSGERGAPRRSRAVILAVATFVLVFVGAAGAFGYRLLFSGGTPGPAPVIRADASPTKVVPAQVGDSGKAIQDRLADRASGEKVVSREEQPVEIRDASRPPTPRMVYPNQTAGAVPATPAGPSAVQPTAPPAPFAAAAAPVTGGEPPKKIRTVTIRSDQGPDPAAKSQTAPALRAAAAAPAPARGDAPMSLNPGAGAAAPAPRLAAASAATGSGYVVQVSAQKTETEAQAAFRSMQKRYPGQLAGKSPLIRRKDTASGTMYGAQVGPFASRDDAVQLCEGLKAAGGSCFVQRN
jgi:hypothetical protein